MFTRTNAADVCRNMRINLSHRHHIGQEPGGAGFAATDPAATTTTITNGTIKHLDVTQIFRIEAAYEDGLTEDEQQSTNDNPRTASAWFVATARTASREPQSI
jgi:hypothetical protein